MVCCADHYLGNLYSRLPRALASADYLNVNHNKMTLGGIEPRGIHPIVLCHRFRRPVLGQEPMDRFKREAYVRSSG